MPNLLGTNSNQTPTIGDLGSMAFQDENAVQILGGSVVADIIGNSFKQNTNMSAVAAALTLDFAKAGYLDPRITFGRASAGAYYDGKTSAVAEQNLALYSQDADNAIWGKIHATVVGNATIAPDGTLTADALYETSATGGHLISQTLSSIAGYNTLSVYVKPITRNWVCIELNGASVYACFDVVNGIVGTTSGAPTTSITPVGNGWYRCVISKLTGATTGAIRVYLASADNITSYTGDGVSGLYVWGAQLEQRSAVSAYTPTTTAAITNYIPQLMTAAANQPRFDYDPVTGESKGLMVEESRANLLTYSADITGWTKSNATIDANVLVAPDGTLSAEGIGESSTASSISLSGVTITANGTYTFSVYAKKSVCDWQRLVVYDGGGSSNRISAWFNLSTGAVGTVSNGGTGSGASATITPVGNGWYRLTLSGAINNSSTSVVCLIASALADSSTTSFAGAYKFVWGAQLEAGAFATSYIATTSAQVTRAQDLPYMQGSSVTRAFSTGSGALFMDFTPMAGNSQNISGNLRYLCAYNSNQAAYAYEHSIYRNASSLLLDYSIRFNASLADFTFARNTRNVVALSWSAAAGFSATNSGAAITTQAYSGVLPSVDTIMLGGRLIADGVLGSMWIRRLVIYPKALASDELVELTI